MKVKVKKTRRSSESDIVMDGKFWIDRNGVRRRYVDPLTDEGFKLMFGVEGNEDLLASLLNSIIPETKIISLRHSGTVHPGMTKSDNKSVFDVYCEGADGVKYLVEMQNWSQRYFNKRAVFYSTYAVQDQAAKEKKRQLKLLKKRQWDYNYAPVYVVCFLSFNMAGSLRDGLGVKKVDECISLYRYMDIETHQELGDGVTLVFVEMPKFRKRLSECRNPRDRWLNSMKNINGQLEMPSELRGTEVEEFYNRAELAALPQEMKISYIQGIMSRNDELNSRAEAIEDALAEGIAIGEVKGREEGEVKGREEVAKNLIAMGLSDEQIVEATGLSVENVQGLRSS